MIVSETVYSEEAYLCALNYLFADEPKIAHAILECLGNAESLFKLGKKELKALFPYASRYPYLINEEVLIKATNEVKELRKHKCNLIPTNNKLYPANLGDCVDRPVCLYAKGNVNNLSGNGMVYIAINGMDSFDGTSMERLKNLFETFLEYDLPVCIVCDLSTDSSRVILRYCALYGFKVIGISSSSIDYLWKGYATVEEKTILDSGKGLIITDTPMDWVFKSKKRANSRQWRIIAGISHALVLLGCEMGSQCINIYKIAHSYGKECFVYPGKMEDEKSIGSNYLISKNIAQAIYCTDFLIHELEHYFV